MTRDGLLSCYWCDVGFVKLMSNVHEPESGFVERRVSNGQSDKEYRDTPMVGVNYNISMGGTNLTD